MTTLQEKPARIAAIIVTRNRLQLLQESVAAIRTQSRSVDELIIIDNDSDDGTREWLDEQPDLTVIHQGNLGGAGGFYRGIKEGYARGHDWFWCMDDDTIPQPEALQCLSAAPQFTDPCTGYLGSVVQWTDGSVHKMNMWLSQPGGPRSVDWYSSVLHDKCVPSLTSSFVSILISRHAVAKVGLPLKEMFIWSDDAEYTYRISKHFSNFLVLDSLVVHKTPVNKDSSFKSITPSEYFKLSYGLRNEIFFRRLQSGRAIGTWARIAVFLVQHSLLLFKRRAPLYVIARMWSGLFFSPRVEKVYPAKPNGRTSQAQV